jgi:RNA polymerase sigma factor (sigma-70 family)
MLRLGYLITRSLPVAEEITHDAFIVVLERCQTIESPGAYLRTTLVRAAVVSRRRHLREADVIATQARQTVVADGPAIDGMWKALGSLPPKQRAALALRFYSDYSHEQIAVALDCPVATARSLTHRGLAARRKDQHRWTR